MQENTVKLMNIIIPFLFLAFAYLFLVRPQKKREKEVQEMRNSLMIGDEVVTIGGLRGKVMKIKEDYVTLEIGSAKTKLDIEKWGIGKKVND